MLPAAVLAVVVLLLLAQNAGAVLPGASFTWAPTSPGLSEPILFTPTVNWGGSAAGNVEWNFGDGTPVVSAAATTDVGHTFATTGPKIVTLKATNGETPPESVLVANTVTLPNVVPIAAFSFRPTSPSTGQEVQFASASSDPGGSIASYGWSFGDGSSSPLPNPAHPYGTPGAKSVTLTVTDSNGATNAQTQQIVVQPAPSTTPVASFAFSPRKPKVGQQVEFVSSAVAAPGGRLTDQRWDLDGDGQFDDARGDVVLETYTTPGPHVVRLRVTDAAGGAAVRERIVPVEAQIARAGFLNPFPVVRVTGEVGRSGTLIRLLGVRAPRGTLVRVACTGRGCPAKVRRLTVGKSHSVRFRTFERLLRAGVKLEVFVRRAGTIGKYTRFAVRAGASPRRTDGCLVPGKTKPVRCPS